MQDWLNSVKQSTRLIILHPNYRLQHKLLWNPIQVQSTAYMRFTGADLSNLAIEGQFLENEIEIDANVGVLVLDEVDRCNDDALLVFTRHLLDKFPTLRLIYLTRVLPFALIQDSAIRQLVEFVPVDDDRFLFDYSAIGDSEKLLLEVNAFGAGSVVLNGLAIRNWDGLLPRLLFFFFIDKGMVTREEIFQTFWPTISVKEATNVFHVTKRKINEILGIDLMQYKSGYYCISDQIELRYDVLHFNQTVQDSEISDFQQIERLLLNALSLYQGDFLLTIDTEWVLKRRSELRESAGEVLYGLGVLYQQKGMAEKADGCYLRAYRFDPMNPEYQQAVQQYLPAFAKV